MKAINLAHSAGDAINAVLAAVGHNFRVLTHLFRLLLCIILIAFVATSSVQSRINPNSLRPTT